MDCVIGLPTNLFFGTGIPPILLFNKGKTHKNTLFIDPKEKFSQGTNQNKLRPGDIARIVGAYTKCKTVEKYAYRATLEEIRENDYNLNIPRYVDTFEVLATIDLPAVQQEIDDLEAQLAAVRKEMRGHLKNLGFAQKWRENIRNGHFYSQSRLRRKTWEIKFGLKFMIESSNKDV